MNMDVDKDKEVLLSPSQSIWTKLNVRVEAVLLQ